MKRRDSDLPPAFRALGERLHEAAQREIAAEAPQRRRVRRPRRLGLVAFAALFAVAGVAGAGTLIDIGAPVEQRAGFPEVATPGGPARVAVQVRDPAGGLPWGAATYQSHAGHECVLAGRLRGSQLGRVENDVFRPLPPGARGGCRDLGPRGLFYNTAVGSEQPLRILVVGRAGRDVSTVRVTTPAGTEAVRPGPGGAFLLVYDHRLTQADVRVTPVQ